MQIDCFPLSELSLTDKLIADYLRKSSNLSEFITDFPSNSSFSNILQNREFTLEKRLILSEELANQYRALPFQESVHSSIESLKDSKTFTVTTGHQLCLFTGPMYFIFKIISTIKLAGDLQKQFPEYRFVPVYWMASEDHDFAEINHTWINNNKLEWMASSGGAVGRMQLTGIDTVLEAFFSALPENANAADWKKLIRDSYGKSNLANAIQSLVHALFGSHGLIVINPDSRPLKQLFAEIMRKELLENSGDKSVNESTLQLQEHGYKTLVNPRSINLFYLADQFRGRIEKSGDSWKITGHDKHWNETQLIEELKSTPENFSPNVVLRPAYQETILPNIAYVGGPGEISYWLQLKSNFQRFHTPFPLLILRDSALILTIRQKSRLEKTGLSVRDLFMSRNDMIARLLPETDLNTDKEKEETLALFGRLRERAKVIDPTLEAFVNAEAQRQIQSIDNVQKKMSRALKQREEVKIQQLDKVLDELFPGGSLNERRDNIFPLLCEYGPSLLDALYDSFDPIKGELKLIQPE